jgi:GNAT superfamily N-acetyltransferase
VSDLVVMPDARRSGVGYALLARAEAFARAEGAPVLRIDVVAPNARARSLYGRFGFRDRTIEMEKVLDPDADVSPPGGTRDVGVSPAPAGRRAE